MLFNNFKVITDDCLQKPLYELDFGACYVLRDDPQIFIGVMIGCLWESSLLEIGYTMFDQKWKNLQDIIDYLKTEGKIQ